MKRKLFIIFLSLVCALSLAFGLTACDLLSDIGNNITNSFYSVQSAYSKAVELGYTGSLADFIAFISNINGIDADDIDSVDISDIAINDDGELIITLADGDIINFGKINNTDDGVSTGDNDDPDDSGSTGGETHTHSLEKTEGVTATCTTDGNITYWYCSDCGKYFSDEDGATEISYSQIFISATGHTESEAVIENEVAATCTEIGSYDSVVYCSVCHEELIRETITIPATGHNTTKTEAVAATCVDDGNIEFWYCNDCGKYFSDEDCTEEITLADMVTAATGLHNYGDDGICTVCGAHKASEGLKYTLNEEDNTYTVSGIGECTDTNIVIPSTYNGLPVTAIGDNAFYYCKSLTNITIPNSIVSIENRAFMGCSSLERLTIPNSVTSIGSWAFFGCYKLIEVYNLSSLTITAGSPSNGFVACYAKNVYTATSGESHLIEQGDYIFVYDSKNNYYLVEYNGTETVLTLPENINGNSYSINQYAFYYCTSLESIVIPDGVTSIGADAFWYCTSLESIVIPDSVTSIGFNAFTECTSLTSIAIPDEVTSIGSYAFSGCTSLTSIIIPDSVTSIGSSAFYGCTSLTSVTV